LKGEKKQGQKKNVELDVKKEKGKGPHDGGDVRVKRDAKAKGRK